MELPDLFSMPLLGEGPKKDGWCLVSVMDQGMDIKLLQYSTWLTLNIGKTNQNGRLEYGSALRHRDYRACLVSALAIYFFWRWHRSGESFPCFRTSQDWYKIRF